MTEIVFIERAPSDGTEHRLEDGATIGRAGCDVKLSDPDVSRRHAILRVEGSAIAVEDLGSTNGTFVNEARIEVATELRDGDRVRFGAVVWELRIPLQATRLAQSVQPGAPSTRAVPVHAPEAQEPELTVAPPRSSERTTARPAEAGRDGSRGDVPKPDFSPSKVARVVAAPGGTPDFSPSGGRFKRSAARRLEATVISYGVVIATAAAIAVYFAQR